MTKHTTVKRGARAAPAVGALALAAFLGLVAACSTPQQLQPVYVPVPVECRVDTPVRPVMPTDVLTAAAVLDRIVQAALAEIEVREGYEVELQVALASCTKKLEAGRRGK